MTRWSQFKELVRNTPWGLKWLWRLRGPFQPDWMKRRVVQPGDEVLIDGFPRSANTFALNAFVYAQQRDIRAGNHFHSPGQFFLAKKYGIPAMLMLRDPVSACLSLYVYNDGAVPARDTLKSYIRFHRSLLTIRDAFVVAPFEEVTTNFDKSIERLNAHFGTSFARLGHDKENEQKVFEIMKARDDSRKAVRGQHKALRVNYPSEAKAARRAECLAEFESRALAELRVEANEYYQTLMSAL